LIWIGALFDFLDGLSARLLKVHSEIGKELDSLADMITFSLLPSIILFEMIQAALPGSYLPYLAFLVAIFSALRLARFNVDTRQATSFIGLPTPANALLISSLPFIAQQENTVSEWVKNPQLLISLCLLLSYLLVSNLQLMAFKLNNIQWSTHKVEIIFLAISLVLLSTLKVVSIPLIVILYVILSLLKRSITSP